VSNLDIKGAVIIEGIPQGIDACKTNANEQAAQETLHRINEYVQQTPTMYLPSHDPDAQGDCRSGKRSFSSQSDLHQTNI